MFTKKLVCLNLIKEEASMMQEFMDLKEHMKRHLLIFVLETQEMEGHLC